MNLSNGSDEIFNFNISYRTKSCTVLDDIFQNIVHEKVAENTNNSRFSWRTQFTMRPNKGQQGDKPPPKSNFMHNMKPNGGILDPL